MSDYKVIQKMTMERHQDGGCCIFFDGERVESITSININCIQSSISIMVETITQPMEVMGNEVKKEIREFRIMR